MKTLAVILIILGALAVAYQGFSYVTREKIIDVGPVEVSAEKQKTVFLPPVLGAIVLVTGVALLLTSSRRAKRITLVKSVRR
jgi:hypothetical protein